MKIMRTVSKCIVRLCVFLFVVAGLVFTGATPRAFGQSKSGFTYNGIAYTTYWYNLYGNGEDPPVATGAATDSLDRLAATGANYASVLATQYVQTYTSTTIAPTVNTPLDDQVEFAIQSVHGLGLNVALKPQVDSLDNVWRGGFDPGGATPPDAASVAAWFASYQTFMVHYAILAQANYVNGDVFVIGTELASLSGSAYESNWETIISAVRAVYSGPIAYASSATGPGDEFTTVSFWDKVDIIGVDGYFPLTNHADPTIPELVSAWTDNLDGFNPVAALQNLQGAYNEPMIFTEVGYESTPGTNEQPWNYSLSDGYDPTEQEDCYEAFFEVFSNQTSWMKGVFWWDWAAGGSTPPYDPSTDTSLDTDGKPAGTVTLPLWYKSATPQSFALSASSPSLTVTPGSKGTSTISVTNAVEFTGVVTLAATGLPSGVTASFATNPTTGSSLLTLTASSTAAGGESTVTITGTAGALTATTPIALTVNVPFALSAPSSSLTVTRGGSGTSTITVTPSGGFTGNVALSAAISSSPSGAVDTPTLSFGSTTPVDITGAGAGTATLTITTTAATSGALVYPKRPAAPWYAAGGATLACLLLFGIPARRRSWRTMLGMLALLVTLAGGVLSCGGGGGSTGGNGGSGNLGTTAGAYTVTVTGTSGTTIATCLVTFTVN